ncbi:hypothetical protein BH20CHL6_BH20CHL6_10290 [soil metagenome]
MLAQLSLFVHIVAAIVLLGGVIGVNLLGGLARAAPDLERRRSIVSLGPSFERMITFGAALSIVTGLVTLVLFGYPITDLWVLATGAVLVVITVIEAVYWPKVGPRVRDALERGDDAVALKLMRDPLSIAVSRFELVLGFVIVGLMVFRPGWPGA